MSIRVHSWAILSALIGVYPWSAAAAQTSPAAPFVGRTVASVRIEVEGRENTEPALADLVQTRPGAPLSMQDVRETVSHLFNLERFQDVEVHAETAGGDVAVRFNLIPVRSVDRIEFAGELGLGEGALRRLITERFGATPPAGRADAAARALEQLYADRGYLRARVAFTFAERQDPDRTTLLFTVDAGPRARVGSINVDGDPGKPVAELLRDLGLAPGAFYDPFELDRRLEDYQQGLRRRSYYEAVASHTRRPRDDGAIVDVTVAVGRGPLVRVMFEGDPLPKERLDDLVPIEREGSADQDLVEDSERRIESFLHAQGYSKAEVSADRVERGDELLIVFLVSRGARSVIDAIEIAGNASVPIEKLRPLLRSEREAPYVASAIEADVATIARLYRQQGFTEVKVAHAVADLDNGSVPARGVGRVAVRIAVAEGPRSAVGAIRIEGNRTVPEGDLRKVMTTQPGAPFYEPAVAADREAVLLEYLNRGHREATVSVEPHAADVAAAPASPGFTQAIDLVYRVSEGPVVLVDHILVVGNRRTSEQTIRNELRVRSGEPLGLADLIDSRRRLSTLGLFRRVGIREVGHGRGDRRDLIITVEEAKPTTVGYGGGVEMNLRSFLEAGAAADRIELAPRGFFEIGRRNLGGRNRSVNFSTRVSFRQRGESLEKPDEPRPGFNEYRVAATYREPRALGWDVDTALTGFLEQGIRTSFNFSRRAISADALRRLRPGLRLNARYSFGRTRVFDERIDTEGEEALAIDRLFSQVRLSSVFGALFYDTRDDPLDPTTGLFVGADGEIAARKIGSQVGYAKTFLQAFLFRPATRARRIVLAGGVRIGLATGFPRDVVTPSGVETVRDLSASERFFAGGSTTVRGFANDKLGAPETISRRDFPIGGNALIVLNAELRAPIWKDVGGVAFVDAGNVFARTTDFSLGDVRSSVGFGLRYGSPFGPIRADLGFKVHKRQLPTGGLEGRTAFHISIGQAF